MKNTTRLLILIFALICFSCSNRDLGDGYYFLPKYESVDVGYPNGEAIIYKSNQEYIFSEVKIRGDVVNVKSDTEFIIAKRDPQISRDNNTGLIEYYIIIKKNDSVIGPLNQEIFKKTIGDNGINLEF